MDGMHDLKRLVWRVMVPVIGAIALWGAAPALATEWIESGNGKITSPKEIKWTNGKFSFFDEYEAGTGQPAVTVTCSDSGTGTVAAKGAGEVKTWTFSSCTDNVGCASPKIVAENLPWTTQLESVSGKVINNIKGLHSPELRWECSGGFFDSCPVVKFPTMSRVEKGVSETWNEELVKAACENDFNGYNDFKGARTLELTNGHKLTFE